MRSSEITADGFRDSWEFVDYHSESSATGHDCEQSFANKSIEPIPTNIFCSHWKCCWEPSPTIHQQRIPNNPFHHVSMIVPGCCVWMDGLPYDQPPNFFPTISAAAVGPHARSATTNQVVDLTLVGEVCIVLDQFLQARRMLTRRWQPGVCRMQKSPHVSAGCANKPMMLIHE